MTQKDMIRNHLIRHGSITPIDAWKMYGCYRLSDVILKLRRMGMQIDTLQVEETNIFGDKVTFAKYRLREEEA